MGLMRFLIPRQDHLLPDAVEQSYICGRDDMPWRAQIVASRDGLVIDRAESDSGNFYIPWSVESHGELILSTATLMEREAPYLLPLELARGTLNRLRTYAWGWAGVGLVVPAELSRIVSQAVSLFAKAVTAQYDPFLASDRAQQVIRLSADGIKLLVGTFADQAATARKLQPQRSTPLIGVNLGRWRTKDEIAPAVLETFNTAAISPSWRAVEAIEGKQRWTRYDAQIQWCQANSLRIAVGPLVQLNQQFLPDWLYLWESDFDNLLDLFGQYVQSVVHRYRGRANLWHCASGLNIGEAMSLSDEQRLRLAVRALEVTHKADPRTAMIVSFGQPWGEYLADRDTDLSPLAFADTLGRAELGVAGFGLEITIGDPNGPTSVRDELELSRLVDRWSLLNLPLVIFLTIAKKGRGPAETDLQQTWLGRYLPMLLARPVVQGVFWNELQDSRKSPIPTAGLFDDDGASKPSFEVLTDIRRRYLS